ncbi:alpha-hydroxy-acid oxidizing protein [Streptomyces kaniharaensis]|uniref:Alpha-hydroxy-acid oxidizing protein n=1 Tax=Streptomyces kaniharaensis TaxID=212423 RepID=A0A6N7L3B0_9ACTN|nr:alpha-hydroxy acid oxidase [Streptomyces kaniharaensis]MQS16624.1 alpha-hydroxy-acid oxidizing protein [Streptomyces kaniharaensis]
MTAVPATFAPEDLLSPADFERAAAALLPAPVRDFVAGGSGTELTLAANRAAFDQVRIVPRALRDVSGCALATTLLGRPVSMPVATAPVGYQKLVHPEGELAAACAAKEAGIPFTVGTLSSYTLEEVAAVGATTWFQLYMLRDRDQSFDLVRRAEDAGCAAVMLTADVPWMARRRRDLRNGFALPDDVVAANLSAGTGSAAHRAASGESAVARHTAAAFAPSLNWADLEELRRRTRLPLLVKGVLDPADAARAAECGVDAVVVSNHGGRQLDGAVASIDVLAEVCTAVAGRCEVLLDSGIRSGVDVLKALALGASGVLVGRPLLWGLATGGTEGAHRVLELLATELRDALGLAGCSEVGAARSLRTFRGPWPADRTGAAYRENGGVEGTVQR